MKKEQVKVSLDGIRQLLSHLHGEISALEGSYDQMLQVLRHLDGACSVEDLDGLLHRKAFFDKWQAVLDACAPVIDVEQFSGRPAAADETLHRVSAIFRAA